MNGAPRFRHPLIALLALGCGGLPAEEGTAESVEALDVCSETVPSDRQVDGIPAYAQCDTSENASIWSNNGIDTSTTEVGADWIRTQRGGGYQCTELAYRYMYFRWNVDYRSGDAQEWCDGTLPSNLVIAPTPVHGDLIIFAGGVCGSDESTGHIAVIDTVDSAAARVTIVEENRAGRRATNQSCATCFLHAVANDGSTGGAAGAPGGAGAAGATAGTGGNSAAGAGGRDGEAAGTGGDGGATAGGAGAPGAGSDAAGGSGGSLGGSSGASGVAGAQVGAAGAGQAGAGAPSSSGGGGGAGAGGASAGGPPVAMAGSPGSGGTDPGVAPEATSTSMANGCAVANGSRGRPRSPFLALLMLAVLLRRAAPSWYRDG